MNATKLVSVAQDIIGFLDGYADDKSLDDAAKAAALEVARSAYNAKIQRESLIAGMQVLFDKIGKT